MPASKNTYTEEERRAKGFTDIRDTFPVDEQHKKVAQRERRKKDREAKSANNNSANNNNNDNNNGKAPKDNRVRTKAGRAARRNAPSDVQQKKARIAAADKERAAASAPKKKAKHKRTSAAADPNMVKAVKDWFSTPENERGMKSKFADKYDVDRRTFSNYVHPDINKRSKLVIDGGNERGRPSIVPKTTAEFLVQHTIRHDRANNGLTNTQVAENLQQIHPEIGPEAASNYVCRTFKKKSQGRIKPKPVKAQKTTSKRSCCTVAQQYRWFKNIEKGFRFLREKNTGVCNKTGKSFGELMDHFVVGGDETCLMTDSDGDLKILGEAGKRKHEKRVSDFRVSTTMFRTGTPAGLNGPTAFIMKGKNRKAGMNEKFLVENGCVKGSTLAMTENAFMTTAAWEEITPKVSIQYNIMCYDYTLLAPLTLLLFPTSHLIHTGSGWLSTDACGA